MERWVVKVIAMLIIFILPAGCTLLPYKVYNYFLKKGKKGKAILSCLMCFGGGVFFGTFIFHMGPEVRAILDKALIEPYHIEYPVADGIMGMGFFLVFFIEKVILKWYKLRNLKKKAKREAQCYQINKLRHYDENNIESESQSSSNAHLSARDANNIVSVSNGHVVTPNNHDNGLKAQLSSLSNDCPLLGTGECCKDPLEIKIQMVDGDQEHLAPEMNPPKDEDTHHAHSTRSLVLIVALSLHRIFEGMSLGLQHSTQSVWNLLVAFLCHETVIGFSLGLQFVKNGFALKKMLLATFLCSLIMPIGVAIGTVIVEVGGNGAGLDLTNGILQAISTGTFIYVTFFEILQGEIDPHDTSMSKFLATFIGYLVMGGLSAVPEGPTADPIVEVGLHMINSSTIQPNW